VADAYNAWLASGRISVPAMDRSSVPRVGKLLGAWLLVQGGISGNADKALRIDAGMTESATGEAKGTGAEAGGPLAELFRMEKELVYELLNQLGVKPSGEERDAIGRLPTRNVNAFLAWSQGLVYEDRGQYDLARQACSRALELDPGFGWARQHLDALSGTAAGFSRADAQVTGQALAGAATPSGGARDRLDVVGAINGGGLAPGRSSDGQLDPTVAPVGVVGGTGTVIVTGEVPRK
jgi:tetratricopeptide (TPR) repeat protein